MSNNITSVNLRSLLLILFAFIGNGQIFGVDMTLTLLAAPLLFLQLTSSSRISSSAILFIILLMTLFGVAALRAPGVGVPYFDAYYLWPLKACFLMLLIALGRPLTWPMGNMIALAGICLMLIAVGRMEGGRFVSIFGPNMLYRIFGFLLCFAVMMNFNTRGFNKILTIILSLLGLFAILITGSSGALLIIAGISVLAILRYSRKIFIAIIGVGALWLTVGGNLALGGFQGIAVYSRFMYKIATLETDARLNGWMEIISSPLSLTGYNHNDFWYLWSYGFEYPHNIFIELFAFYGLAGWLLGALLLVGIAVSLRPMVRGDVLALTLMVLTLGALLSGDLSDNYGALGLAAGLLLRRQSARRTAARGGRPLRPAETAFSNPSGPAFSKRV